MDGYEIRRGLSDYETEPGLPNELRKAIIELTYEVDQIRGLVTNYKVVLRDVLK